MRQIKNSSSGQAMVEFVIILIALMAMCAGMLYTSRLLTFQFWAQQEARLLAFDQDWVAQEGGVDTAGILADGTKLHRPRLVSGLDSSKDSTPDGSISTLLDMFAAAPTGGLDSSRARRPISDLDSTPTVLADARPNPIWKEKTVDWVHGIEHDLGHRFTLVSAAFASQDGESDNGLESDYYNAESYYPGKRLEQGLTHFLTQGEFGETFCREMASLLGARGIRPESTIFSAPECPADLDLSFGKFLARNVNFQDFFRSYGHEMETGLTPGPALESAIEQEVATQFYSFFDTKVKQLFQGAVAALTAEHAMAQPTIIGADYMRMLVDARYVGSIVALGAIQTLVGNISALNPNNRNVQSEIDFEKSMYDIIHVDAENDLPLGANGFWLSPLYLPVPPDMTGMAGGLFAAPMRNILFSDGAGVIDDLVDNSNKEIEVKYHGDKGLLGAARRRFSVHKTLTSKFYLVTQPWHIDRRQDGTGAFRDLGDEFEDIGSSTEEGILRRRVKGLWLIPTDIGAFTQPLTDLMTDAGLPNMGDMLTVLSMLGGPIDLIKDLISGNNAINQIFDAIRQIPGIGIDLTFPLQPAVRPKSYTNTKELTNDAKMGGAPRNFAKYIDEQKDWKDVEPDPSYN